MLTQTQHAVEGNSRIVTSALIDRNAVDDVAFAEVFKRPKEMLRGNAEHRGADADAGIERDDFAVPEFLAEAVDEVDFRAHSPLRAGGKSRDGLDDAITAFPAGTEWAVGTEIHLVNRLGKEFRDRKVISLDPSVCVCTTMFRITPQHLLWALENLGEGHVVNRISVDERTRHYARVALDRMLSLR